MKTLLLAIFALTLINCSKSSDDNFDNFDIPQNSSGSCTYNGHTLHVGEEGGCYYINSSGNKVYVDRSNCSGCN